MYLKLIEVDFHQLHHVCLPESGTEIFIVPVCGSVGLQKVWQGQVGVGVLLPEEVSVSPLEMRSCKSHGHVYSIDPKKGKHLKSTRPREQKTGGKIDW